MMNILETIIVTKQKEIAARKQIKSISDLERTDFFKRETYSLKTALLAEKKTGIIAEFKRKSPSKGIINATARVEAVTKAYTSHGASALSVLTDIDYFGGSDADLQSARINEIPILRKDFVVDEYQLIESKSIGADAILLIAACLTVKQVKSLSAMAKNLGLSVLLELHSPDELNHICETTDIIGINNRNLKTFEVDIEQSIRMAEQLPIDTIKIAESGIRSVADINHFKANGFDGFLIGENFMKEEDPGAAFKNFVQQL